MSQTDPIDILLTDLEEADSVPEIQSQVLAANKLLDERFGNDELRVAGDGEVNDSRLNMLVRWISALEEKMGEVAQSEDIENYSVTVSGSIAGPSVSVSITCSTE